MKVPVTQMRRMHHGPVNVPNVRRPLNSLRWLMRRETGWSGRFKPHVVNVSPAASVEWNPEQRMGMEINQKSGQVLRNVMVELLVIV